MCASSFFRTGQDPDEFVRQSGKDGFDRLKDEALTLNAFKLEAMARSYSMEKENEREQYAMEACRFIASLMPIERERMYQLLSKKTGYSLETLRAQGASARPLERQQPVTATRDRPRFIRRGKQEAESERERAENALIFHMLQSRGAAQIVWDQDDEKQFSSEGLRAFARALKTAYQRKEEPNLPLILAGMEKEDAERVSAALREEAACAEPEKAARDCLCRIERCDLSEQMEEIKRRLTDPVLGAEQRAELFREMQTLNLRMRALG